MSLMKTDSAITDFVALDVETAAELPGSICQVGLAIFRNRQLSWLSSFAVAPKCAFSPRISKIHGLTERDVIGSPTWREIYPEIAHELHGNILVSHSNFDRRQIFAACCRSGSTMFSYRRWVDTSALARKAWPTLQSYSLHALASELGMAHKPHDAVDDARISGEILIRAQRVLAAV